MPRILGIGALYEDTILTVDRLEEDSKKHASLKEVRIGGNILNTFDVLSESPPLTEAGERLEVEFLGPVGTRESCRHVYTDFLQRGIIPRLIHRESTGTACAYIICSEATGSRTIISHLNSLADPTAAELEREVTWPDWIHVEGRNCVEVLRFIKAIKERGWEGRVSVDFEIPREGLRELVPVADVLFISRAFANSVAEAAGDTFKPRRVHAGSREPEAAAFVRGVMDTLGDEMQLGAEGHFLMGDAGSFCFLWDKEYPVLGFKENTPLERPIVETIGAGDTFIAAALWGGLRGLNLVQVNDLATRIARKKIVAIGFKGLWHGESVVGYSKYTWDPDAALN